MTLIDVDFVIPTLNINPDDLISCKNSILSQTGSFEKNIFVENGFSFTKGVNEGIKKGKSPIVAIINDDVKLHKNWLHEAYVVLEKNSNCAAIATKVLSFDGKYIDSCGLSIGFEGKAFKIGYREEVSNDKYNTIKEVFGVPCSAALFRREALEKVRLFDEDFGSYLEDIDLSFRLRMLGYTIFYAPKAIAYHKIHATSKKLGNLKARMDVKNWIYIILKNYPLSFIIKYARPIIIERLRNLSGLFKQTIYIYNWKSIWLIPYSLFTTYGEVIIKFPKMLRKRKEIQSSKAINKAQLISWLINNA